MRRPLPWIHMKIMSMLLLLGAGAIFGGTSCSEAKKEKEEKIKLLVTSPLRKDTTVAKTYVAQVHAIQHIDIRALEKGYLEKTFVDEGQHVQQGQLMFQIKPLIYKAELQKAQAEANFVDIEYQNTKQLADKNVVSKSELALAKAKVGKARAEVALSEAHLQFTTIKAPFSGIMDHFQVRLGSLVDEGDLLTTLSDNSQMWVYYNVPEAEYLTYQEHARATDKPLHVQLLMANNEVFDQIGVVKTIEADFNNETGSVVMTVPLKHALLIPQKATFEILEKKYVFVVDKNNVVHQQEVTIGSEMSGLYAIKKGLTGTERILLEGLRKVKDGDKINYDYREPQAVISHLKVYAE